MAKRISNTFKQGRSFVVSCAMAERLREHQSLADLHRVINPEFIIVTLRYSLNMKNYGSNIIVRKRTQQFANICRVQHSIGN